MEYFMRFCIIFMLTMILMSLVNGVIVLFGGAVLNFPVMTGVVFVCSLVNAAVKVTYK